MSITTLYLIKQGQIQGVHREQVYPAPDITFATHKTCMDEKIVKSKVVAKNRNGCNEVNANNAHIINIY